MPLPTLHELNDAYRAGLHCTAQCKNPYPWGTALWIEWNHGCAANPRCFIERSTNRLRTVGRYMLFGALAGIAAGWAMYALR